MKIKMSHGSGGSDTSQLINDVFMQYFSNHYNAPMEDSALLNISGRLAFTTDSFVVKPVFFPGGNIGRLSICGTVNDLLTAGAVPKYLSAAFILEEGLPIEDLHKICRSMAETAKEAGVQIVTGDTKVIEGNGGICINTSGIGALEDSPFSFGNACEGDAIIVTGNLGDHHACILSRRMAIENTIKSDASPLCDIVFSLKKAKIPVHGMRDITRGGLATVLNEIFAASGFAPVIMEEDIPVGEEVKAFAKILGLDPLAMGNEGKLVLLVPKEYAEKALQIIKNAEYGENAVCIGTMQGGGRPSMITAYGGKRIIAPLMGEGLPRIC